MQKGLIALDIDGTITDQIFSVPKPVVAYLKSLHESGWQILLTTGRSFTFAIKGLEQFDFPFFFSIQNGSAALKMPSKETLFTDYLPIQVVNEVHSSMDGLDGVMVVYSGHRQKDRCYWIRDAVQRDYHVYLKKLMERQRQEGIAVDEFVTTELDEVSLIKCVGPYDQLMIAADRIQKKNLCSMSLLKDPFDPKYHMLMLTKLAVDKGSSLRKIIAEAGNEGKIIVGGNDGNDLSLFREGDWKIAMKGSPSELLEQADFIAPPVEEMGIISALQYATERR